MLKRYADDYENVVTTDENGNEKKVPVYRGKYYQVALDVESLARFKRNNLAVLAVILVLHIAAGFVGNPGMYRLYVALPYVVALAPLYNAFTGVLRVPREARKYRRDEVGLSFERIKTAVFFLTGVLAAGLLGEIVFLLTSTTEAGRGLEYIYLSLEALAAGTTFLAIQLQKSARVQVLDEE